MPSFPCPGCGKHFPNTVLMRRCMRAHASDTGKQAAAAQNDTTGSARALWQSFVLASTFDGTLNAFRELTTAAGGVDKIPTFTSGVHHLALQLFATLDARRQLTRHGSTSYSGLRAVVVGAGPAGLRTAIELCVLGASDVTVVEKRDEFTRNNVVVLWPTTIADLLALGVKTFYPSLATGGHNHLGIRRLQLVLLQVALVCGVKVLPATQFVGVEAPGANDEGTNGRDVDGCHGNPALYRATVKSEDGVHHSLAFHHLVGADGEHTCVGKELGFERKHFKAGTALGLTFNYANTRSAEEVQVEEVNWAKHFHQVWFQELKAATSVEFENIVYFRGETHYIVCTPRKEDLLAVGVLTQPQPDVRTLLSAPNVDGTHLRALCTRIAGFLGIPEGCQIVLAANGSPDCQLFDFTSKSGASNSVFQFDKWGLHLLGGIPREQSANPFNQQQKTPPAGQETVQAVRKSRCRRWHQHQQALWGALGGRRPSSSLLATGHRCKPCCLVCAGHGIFHLAAVGERQRGWCCGTPPACP